MAVERLATAPDCRPSATVRRLYTPAMLAELVKAPVAAIRRWHRRGALRAVRCVRRLPYFDFEEVAIARRLAQLLAAGCSLRTIDRRLDELGRLVPGAERPLADPDLVVEGKQLLLWRGDDLSEPGGQLLIDFESTPADESDRRRAVISMAAPGSALAGAAGAVARAASDPALPLIERLHQDALDFEDEGLLDRAAETYRTMLMAGGPRAELHFALADVLYRAGDLPAARERYYAALELDEEYVEARASLGCVLAESGELELAAATLEGALGYDPEFADVHYHLANALDRLGRFEEAAAHLRLFLELAPESPWAESARDRLLGADSVALD
jgi:tetratricopeptide (TPR) repeat protein